MENFKSLQERMFRESRGLPPTANLNPGRTEKAVQQATNPPGEEKTDWVQPKVYESIGEFEQNIPSLVGDLSAGDPKVKYGSKKAVHNYRELIRNVGGLYRDYLLAY